MNKPSVIVHQWGSRRRYAVPRMLESHKMLEALWTDSHAESLLGVVARLCKSFSSSRLVQRLTARNVKGVPRRSIRSADSWLYHGIRLKRERYSGAAEWLRARDEVTFSILRRYGFGGANLFYSMSAANLKFLDYAMEKGVKTIVDAFISPSSLRTMRFEKERLGMELNWDEARHEEFEDYYAKVFHSASGILCPSAWVAEGVSELDQSLSEKIIVCPYGATLSAAPLERLPVPRSVFWAGGDWFRKGLHHLAAAADVLVSRKAGFEVRVAGITDPRVVSDPRFRNLLFLGKLNREQMQAEFVTADAFVFPTLSEGMAGVVVEAISAGCPVVTTRSAGVDAIEHGKSGLILEAGDPQLWADELESLCSDRDRIEAMSRETRLLAEQFTEEAWGKRLIKVLEDLVS
jgi:glycosyltransferase involved in cell wall biosynthesis